jgi:hypothetical protein
MIPFDGSVIGRYRRGDQDTDATDAWSINDMANAGKRIKYRTYLKLFQDKAVAGLLVFTIDQTLSRR